MIRKSEHVKATPITLEQCFRDQLSKYRTTDTVDDIIKQFENKNLTVTEASHDTQTANMKASTQCNNGTEKVTIKLAQMQ